MKETRDWYLRQLDELETQLNRESFSPWAPGFDVWRHRMNAVISDVAGASSALAIRFNWLPWQRTGGRTDSPRGRDRALIAVPDRLDEVKQQAREVIEALRWDIGRIAPQAGPEADPGAETKTVGMEYDVFICHASEDKAAVVEPLAAALRQQGLRVWLDQMEIRLGDSLSRKIDYGLAHSRFGVVVVSRAVLAKDTGWVRRELNALATREAQGNDVVVLPIWHEVGQEEVSAYSPTLADKLAAQTRDGLDTVVELILSVCRPAPPNGQPS